MDTDQDLENFEMSEDDLKLVLLLRDSKKRKRRKFLLALLLITSIVAIIGTYVVLHPRELLFLKEDIINVELGDKVSIVPTEYLDKESTDEDAYENATLSAPYLKSDDYSVLENETLVSKDKDYLDIGTYKFKISYLSQSKEVTINVIDTTKPVFEVFTKNIKVEEETKEIKWTDYYQATDLEDVEIKVDDSKVDLNKAGKYKISVTATDKANNSVTKNAVVTVEEKPKPTPTPTPEPQQKETTSSSSSSNNASSGNTYVAPEPEQQQVQQPVQQQTVPDVSHGTEYFMFDSGYDFDSAYGACVAAMNSHGSGSCTPMTGDDGNYTGYRLDY